MNWRPLVPFVFTLSAMMAGVTSILMAASGNFVLSAKLIMLSMILDGLDGQIARRLNATSNFGAELDTFVDIVSFGVAPAFLAWQAALHEFGVWGMALVCAIVMSGAMRLARFRVIDDDRGQKGYLGLPITVMGGFLAVVILTIESNLLYYDWLSLTDGPVATLVWTVTVMFTLLQVSHLHYSKPTKVPVIFSICFLGVLLLFVNQALAVVSALAMCAGFFFYGFVTPFLPKHEVIIEIDDDEEEPLPVRHS